MSRAGWRLVDAVSGLLEPDEREAVRGDLAESGVEAGPALWGVLGLVVRRQVALWKNWRPWLALVALVAPLGMLLGLNSSWMGRSYELYLWIVRNYSVIDPAILRNTGLWTAPGILFLICHSLLLAAWSWTAGFVLASLTGRAIRVTGPLFCAVLLLGEQLGAPKSYYAVAGAMFATSVYSVVLPLILLAILVLVPSIWGMLRGLRLSTLPRAQAILWAVAITALTLLAPRMGGWWWNWPVAYILITARPRRRNA